MRIGLGRWLMIALFGLALQGCGGEGEGTAQGLEDVSPSGASSTEVEEGDASEARADASAGSADAQASEPGPAPGDPGQLGEHPVGHTEMTVQDPADEARRLPTQIWYPAATFDPQSLTTYVVGKMGPFELELDSDHVQRGVPAAEGPWPLVIFSHGYGGISTQSLDLCERLASHGFVVASAAHTGNTAEDEFEGKLVDRDEALADRPRDVRTLIDTFTSGEALPALLQGLVDPERIGVTGHSFGGYTSLSAAAGHADSEMAPEARVKAIAPICPDSSPFSDSELSAVSIPVLFVGGTLDVGTPIEPQITRPFELMTEAPRVRVDVLGATHTHFANICTIGEALIALGIEPESWEDIGAGQLLEIYGETCGDAAFPIDEAIRIQTHYVVAFFRTHLLEEAAWEGLMSDDYAETCEPDVALYSAGLSEGLVAPLCLDEPE